MIHHLVATPTEDSLTEFFQKTLDSLLAHIAILEADGTILAVNAPWNAFATRNGLMPNRSGPGINYLGICERATGPCSEESEEVAEGIRAVSSGRLNDFSPEYPCHSPTEQLWYFVRVTRFEIDGQLRLVVTHDNITERKLAEIRLREANLHLEQQALTDGLTGLWNRRKFDATLELEWARHERTQAPLSLVMADVDFFKRYNDREGHLGGDDCLRDVARTIESSVRRPNDLVARYGGEEFAVIVPAADRSGVLKVAENIARALRLLKLPHPCSDAGPFVTLSLGCATAVPDRDTPCRSLIDQADQALYRAKAAGRDRVVHFEAARAGVFTCSARDG